MCTFLVIYGQVNKITELSSFPNLYQVLVIRNICLAEIIIQNLLFKGQDCKSKHASDINKKTLKLKVNIAGANWIQTTPVYAIEVGLISFLPCES